MKASVVKLFEYPELSIFALLLFFSLFLGILLWTFRRNSGEIYDSVSSKILFEDKEV